MEDSSRGQLPIAELQIVTANPPINEMTPCFDKTAKLLVRLRKVKVGKEPGVFKVNKELLKDLSSTIIRDYMVSWLLFSNLAPLLLTGKGAGHLYL